MNIPKIIGLIVIALFITMTIGFSNLALFIDLVTIQLVFGVTFASAFVTSPYSVVKLIPSILQYCLRPGRKNGYSPKSYSEIKPFIDMFESMSRVALAAGIVGSLICLILILSSMPLESIGANLALTLLSMFYGLTLSELLLQPIKRMVISRFESSTEVEEIYKQQLQINEGQRYSSQYNVVITILFFICGIIFLTIFALSGVNEKEKELSIWKKNGVTTLSIIPHSLNGRNAHEFWTAHLPQSFDLTELGLTNSDDSLCIGIDTVNIQQLNRSECMVQIYLRSYRDSANSAAPKVLELFQYPVSLVEKRRILYENDSLSLDFTIEPQLDAASTL